MPDRKSVNTTCRMCGTLCGITAHIENNRVVDIEGNPEHLFSKGRTCIKGSSAVTWLNRPDRIFKPLKRNMAGEFEEIELERAMDEIAAKLIEIQKNMATTQSESGRARE